MAPHFTYISCLLHLDFCPKAYLMQQHGMGSLFMDSLELWVCIPWDNGLPFSNLWMDEWGMFPQLHRGFRGDHTYLSTAPSYLLMLVLPPFLSFHSLSSSLLLIAVRSQINNLHVSPYLRFCFLRDIHTKTPNLLKNMEFSSAGLRVIYYIA